MFFEAADSIGSLSAMHIRFYGSGFSWFWAPASSAGKSDLSQVAHNCQPSTRNLGRKIFSGFLFMPTVELRQFKLWGDKTGGVLKRLIVPPLRRISRKKRQLAVFHRIFPVYLGLP